jgi:hypothetical protein
MGVVGRGERSGCEGGKEVGALFRIHESASESEDSLKT